MNRIYQILLYTSAVLLVSCNTVSLKNLEGDWIAQGYNCEDLTNLSEEINIKKVGPTFYAIKVTGDNCIEAGDTSWYGNLVGDKVLGKVKGMNPQTQEVGWFDCEVHKGLGSLFLSVDKYQILKMDRK